MEGVYPRVCGGTALDKERVYLWDGLSPRVRGNPLTINLHIAYARSIPACAGEPSSGSTDSTDGWVYPRVCGGTRVDGRNGSSWKGSIPACAGEPGGPGLPLHP